MSTTDRGWSSAGLPTVADDETLWTVADAAGLLGPPQLNKTQVRQLIRMTQIEPVGKRRVTARGTPGRHARVYKAEALIKAYDALSRVL